MAPDGRLLYFVLQIDIMAVRIIINVLKEMFLGRLTSLRGDINGQRCRSLRSCSLLFFLCGYKEGKVCRYRPRTVDRPKAPLRLPYATLPQEMIRRVIECQKSSAFGNQHLDNIIVFNTKLPFRYK